MNVYTAGMVDVALKPGLLLKALAVECSQGRSCFQEDCLAVWCVGGHRRNIQLIGKSVLQPIGHKASREQIFKPFLN